MTSTERRVLLAVDGPQLLDDVGDRPGKLGGEAGSGHDLGRLRRVDAHERVNRNLGQSVGPLYRELLDLHAALDRAHGQVTALSAVKQHAKVELLGDRGARCDHHAVNRVALDVHAKDRGRRRLGIVRGLRDLDATGLAAAPHLHLRLDDGDAAQLLGRGTSLGGGGGDDAGQHGDAVLLEHVARLVLEEVHPQSFGVGADAGCACWVSGASLMRRRAPDSPFPTPSVLDKGPCRRPRLAGIPIPRLLRRSAIGTGAPGPLRSPHCRPRHLRCLQDELKWLLPVGRSGASIAASYVGIAAVVFSFLGFFGLALGLTSLGLGIWARTLSRKGKGGGGRAIFAIVAGIFAIVVGSLTAVMYLQGPG